MIIFVYDGLNGRVNTIDVYHLRYDVIAAHNLFPGAKLSVGFQLPINPLDSHGQPVDPPAKRELERMGEGDYDARIRQIAGVYRDLGHDIFLRIGYEFDGPWNNYDPQAYQAAFRRIVDIFRAEEAANVAFVWNAYTPQCQTDDSLPEHTMFDCQDQMRWYPGDSYVDWFSFNVWTKGFWPPNIPDGTPHADATAFMKFAEAHSKPVMIDEGSYSTHIDSGYRWDEWHAAYFASLRASGVKGYQYVNYNWQVYPRAWGWSSWADAKVTPPHALGATSNTPIAQRAELYDAEMSDDVYLHRGATYYNPVALWIKPTRNVAESLVLPGTSEVDGQPVKPKYDEYSTLPGYGYDPGNALHYYGNGVATYWGNPDDTTAVSFTLIVPPGTSGYIDMEAHAYSDAIGHRGAAVPSLENTFALIAPPPAPATLSITGPPATAVQLPHTIYVGERAALRQITPEGPYKLGFTPADLREDALPIRVVGPPGSQVRVQHIGIQTISPDAPAVPTSLRVTPVVGDVLEISWQPVARAALYNIYRDGELIGTSAAPTYFGHQPSSSGAGAYQVSAWHRRQGESHLSSPVHVDAA
jgi:hypothetical protein